MVKKCNQAIISLLTHDVHILIYRDYELTDINICSSHAQYDSHANPLINNEMICVITRQSSTTLISFLLLKYYITITHHVNPSTNID